MGRKGTVVRLQVRRRPKISGHDVYVEARETGLVMGNNLGVG